MRSCLVVLLVVNLVLNPAPVPAVGLGFAHRPCRTADRCRSASSAPVILGGRGGIDISVGPLMGFVNAVVIQLLFLKAGISSPLVIIPAALLIGGAIGAFNGALTTLVRISRLWRRLAPIWC